MWILKTKAILVVLMLAVMAAGNREARFDAASRAIRAEVSRPLPGGWSDQQLLRARAEVKYLRQLENELD